MIFDIICYALIPYLIVILVYVVWKDIVEWKRERKEKEMTYAIQSKDDYLITYYKKQNQVIITLPQTMETMTNTRTPYCYRKVDVSDEELTLLLNVARMIFNGR